MVRQREKTQTKNKESQYIHEAYVAAINTMNNFLDRYNQTSIPINLIISYDLDGSNEFHFYDENGIKLENVWFDVPSKVIFRNEGPNQIEVMNRRVRLCVTKSARNSRLMIEYYDESECMLSDLFSVVNWASIDKSDKAIEFMIVE